MKTLAYGIGVPLCLSLLACDPSAPDSGPQDNLASALTATTRETGLIPLPLPDPCLTSAPNATQDLGAYSVIVQSAGTLPPPPVSLPGHPVIAGCTAYVADFTVSAGSLPPPDFGTWTYAPPLVMLSGSASFGEDRLYTSTDCAKIYGQIEILQQKSGTSSFVSIASGTVKGLWSGGRCIQDRPFASATLPFPTSGVDKYRVKITANKGGENVQVAAFMNRLAHDNLH